MSIPKVGIVMSRGKQLGVRYVLEGSVQCEQNKVRVNAQLICGPNGSRRTSPTCSSGFVTLPCRERKVSAAQELLGRCDCGPPRGHRGTAKRAVRLGGDEMALEVEGVVDGGVG